MKRIAVMTSGGDSPGMNPAVRAVTRTGINMDMEVFGVRNGYAGLLEADFIPLDHNAVSGWSRLPGTWLQTSRCPEFMTPEGQDKGVRILREREIDGLIVIGGDGSLRGALELHNRGIPTIGLPGTIDNDIYGTDMGIGVDTALNTIINLVDMIKSTAASHRRCFVVEVMGRGSGYLALMTAISTGCQAAVVPEYPLNIPRIVEVLDKRFQRKHNNSCIIVAEGVCSGEEFVHKLDEYKDEIRQEVRLTVLGHVQRGGVPTHYDRLLGAKMGEMAVLSLRQGDRGCLVCQEGKNMMLRDLEEVLGRKRTLSSSATRLARNMGLEIGDCA